MRMRKNVDQTLVAVLLWLPVQGRALAASEIDAQPAAAQSAAAVVALPSPAVSGPTETHEPSGELRLADALALALERSPELASYGWRLRASESREIQAGLRPNPELGFRTEDIGVSGVTRGIDQAEMTIELGQLIELGGKRSARIDRAERGRELAAWDYEVARIDVLARVAQAFIGVLVAQEQLGLADEGARLAREVVDAVSVRVRAGSTSTVELTKSQVAVAFAKVDQEEARRALEAARRQLAATWASTMPAFSKAVGALDRMTALPPLRDLEAQIDDSPDVARWTTELLERRAAIELERSLAVPDVTATGGYRRLFDPDESTFVVGLSVPLPILNRNQGAILEAESQLAQAREDQRSARVRVTTALADTYQALVSSRTQIATLDSDVLPGAREAFATLNAGYREGRFSYLDVLDAQRTLIGARAQRVRALGDNHRAVVAIERLLGEPLSATTTSPRDAIGEP
jgi:outer membrane protein, heavy metal efflux system